MSRVQVKRCQGAKCVGLEGESIGQLVAAVFLVKRLVGARVLDTCVQCHEPCRFSYSVRLSFDPCGDQAMCGGMAMCEGVAMSVCLYAAKQTTGAPMDERCWREEVVDAECGLVRVEGDAEWESQWGKMLGTTIYGCIKTDVGYFWDLGFFRSRHVAYERCSLHAQLNSQHDVTEQLM